MKRSTYSIWIVYSFLVMIKMWINNTIITSKLKNMLKLFYSWLENWIYKVWLGKSKSPYDVFCKLCVKGITISTMGLGALDSHAENKKHQIKLKERMQGLDLLFKWTASDKQTIITSSSSKNSSWSKTVTNNLNELFSIRQCFECTNILPIESSWRTFFL